MFTISHVHITDDIHNTTVGFLRQTLVLATISCLHVEDRNMQAFRTDNRKAAICITQHENRIWFHFHHQLVTLSNDITHSFTKVVTHGLQIHIWIPKLQILKEHTVQIIVVILTCVCQQTVKVLPTFINHCCQTYNLWTCANYNQQLQFPIILKFCHISLFY